MFDNISFYYRMNKPSPMFPLLDLRLMICSRDLDVLRVQRIIAAPREFLKKCV